MNSESTCIAMFVKIQDTNNSSGSYKKKEVKKTDKRYSHCVGNGHLKESCFKIIGYPNWYKDSNDQKPNV